MGILRATSQIQLIPFGNLLFNQVSKIIPNQGEMELLLPQMRR